MSKGKGVAKPLGGSWDTLQPKLTPWVRDVVDKMGFVAMTPVQAGTIPRAMKHQDCVVEAVTGSGKTLAFVLPVLERLCRRDTPYRKGQIAAVVIAPTRELAQQIHEVFNHFLRSLIPAVDPSSPSTSSSPPPPPEADTEEAPYPLPMLVTSGTPTLYETFASQAPQIIIGTPGRLASFLLSPRGLSIVKVNELDCLILDEADRLLSAPDHRRDVERIMRHLPKQRRTHLFSATMTDAVEDIIGIGLRNPVRIVVNLKDKRTGEEAKERRTPMGLQNTVLVCRHAEKTLQLTRLLRREAKQREAARFIVYFSTVAAVDYFYRILSRLPELSSYAFTSLHGDLPPRVRETALSSFTTHASSHLSPAVLLCTDVAARGVDFADIDTVIQYDPPTDPKTFSHRAGRTARAGKQGRAILLLGTGREEDYIEFLNVRKIPLVRESYLDTELAPVDLPPLLDPAAVELMHTIRGYLLTDREMHDKAAKAFVSSLRAYSKHEATFIFRLVDLDFHSLAIGFGLLRMPAMPEIKEWRKKREARAKKAKLEITEQIKVEEGATPAPAPDVQEAGTEAEAEPADPIPEAENIEWEDAEVDWDSFRYLSKTREAARLLALEAKKTAPPPSESSLAKRKIKAEMREAWSEQKDRKARREERRDKRDTRKQREWEKEQAEGGDVGIVEEFKRKKAKVKREAEEGQEEDQREYKALKREVKEEKLSKKGQGREEKVVGGAFDDLD